MNYLSSIKHSVLVNPCSTAKNLLNSCKEKMHSAVQCLGCLDEKLKPIKLINKIVTASAKTFLFCTESKDKIINDIYAYSKAPKKYLVLLKALKSINQLIHPNQSDPNLSKIIKITNYSSLILFGFTLTEFAEQFQVADLSPIHQFCQEVPILGMLPFMGVPTITTVTLLACLALKGMIQEKEIDNDRKTFRAKQDFWAEIKNYLITNKKQKLKKIINRKTKKQSVKCASQIDVNSKVSFFSDFDKLDNKSKKQKIATKQNKWRKYTINNEWKASAHQFLMMKKIIRIGSLVLQTGFILFPPSFDITKTVFSLAINVLKTFNLTFTLTAMYARYHVVSYDAIKKKIAI